MLCVRERECVCVCANVSVCLCTGAREVEREERPRDKMTPFLVTCGNSATCTTLFGMEERDGDCLCARKTDSSPTNLQGSELDISFDCGHEKRLVTFLLRLL